MVPQENQEDDRTRSYVALAAGTVVSHYKIIDKIGAGGMGEVYLAEDTELNRKVALKFLPPHLCQDEDFRARFKREAQAAAKLSHPNIVTIYEVSEYKGRPFFAMEHIVGRSLRDLVKEKELGLGRVVDLAIQMSDGLQEAHEAGIAHRDIKPSNIIVDRKGHAKLLDFGLAAVMGADKLTKTGSTLGTVGYMSPEQARGQKMDHRSDLFSLGVVIYEMVTGRRPFKGEDEASTLHAVTHDTPQPLARYCSDPTDDLQRVVSKLLEKDSGLRYQSAAGLISDLRKLKKDSESGVSTVQPKPSIAVLPFTNLSADPEQEYFCDVMAEEIINALTHVEGMRVVARTSCFAFKGKHIDIREIGQKLNVETVLEGSVRKSGNQLRITGQLVNVADGYHIWSERYDREMEDVFAIQDEISLAIVEKLKVKLMGAEKARPVKRHTEDLDVYNLYLKGQYFSNKRTARALNRAIECFEQAIGRDSEYALAHVGLADSYAMLPFYSKATIPEVLYKAKQAVQKALDIDSTLAEAHASMALISTNLEFDWSSGEEEFKRGIELNPGYATAHHWYALHLMYLGQSEGAIAEIQRALELDPLSLVVNRDVGQVYYYSRDYDLALEAAQKTIDMDPTFSFAHHCLGLAYLQKSMFPEALAAFQKEKSIAGDVLGNYIDSCTCITYAKMGKIKEARRLLSDFSSQLEQFSNRAYMLAIMHFALGEYDQGFDWLEGAHQERSPDMRLLKVDPLFDCVRADPRFTAMLKKMGLE